MADLHEAYMRQALTEAEAALADREVPVGCVIVKDGNVIACGRNATNVSWNGTRHAELVALDSLFESGDRARDFFRSCTLYVTIEPCIMCASALAQVGMGRVVFGAHNAHFGGCGSRLSVHDPGYEAAPHQGLDVLPGVLADEAVEVLKRFYGRPNPRAVAAGKRSRMQGKV